MKHIGTKEEVLKKLNVLLKNARCPEEKDEISYTIETIEDGTRSIEDALAWVGIVLK